MGHGQGLEGLATAVGRLHRRRTQRHRPVMVGIGWRCIAGIRHGREAATRGVTPGRGGVLSECGGARRRLTRAVHPDVTARRRDRGVARRHVDARALEVGVPAAVLYGAAPVHLTPGAVADGQGVREGVGPCRDSLRVERALAGAAAHLPPRSGRLAGHDTADIGVDGQDVERTRAPARRGRLQRAPIPVIRAVGRARLDHDGVIGHCRRSRVVGG